MRKRWTLLIFGLAAIPVLLSIHLPPAAAAGRVCCADSAAADGPQTGRFIAKGGPPPHAPAHGYRAKYQYRYYPSTAVYYDTGRRIWFYIKAGEWTFGASLPAGLKAELGESVAIGLDDDKPYLHYDEHAQQYPSQKYKKKK